MKFAELTVFGQDPSYRTRDGTHHHGFCFDHILAEFHTTEHGPGADTGRREAHIGPHLTPVAAQSQSPLTMSSIWYFFFGSLMPIFNVRPPSSSVSIINRVCICPPVQRRAEAASTPSGAPPMPRAISMPVFGSAQ